MALIDLSLHSALVPKGCHFIAPLAHIQQFLIVLFLYFNCIVSNDFFSQLYFFHRMIWWCLCIKTCKLSMWFFSYFIYILSIKNVLHFIKQHFSNDRWNIKYIFLLKNDIDLLYLLQKIRCENVCIFRSNWRILI